MSVWQCMLFDNKWALCRITDCKNSSNNDSNKFHNATTVWNGKEWSVWKWYQFHSNILPRARDMHSHTRIQITMQVNQFSKAAPNAHTQPHVHVRTCLNESKNCKDGDTNCNSKYWEMFVWLLLLPLF